MIAFISDIHGNSIALDQFSHFIDKNNIDLQMVYFLGDAVNYYPNSAYVLDQLKKMNARCVLGNHEGFLLDRKIFTDEKESVYRMQNTLRQLSEKHLDFIRSWSEKITIAFEDKRFLFVHGSPFDTQNGYIYPDTDINQFMNIEEDVVVCGHSHYTSVHQVGSKTFINVGSLGLPRDRGDYLSFGLLDTENMQFKLHRLKMDINKILSSFEKQIHPSVTNLFNRANLEVKEEISISL